MNETRCTDVYRVFLNDLTAILFLLVSSVFFNFES